MATRDAPTLQGDHILVTAHGGSGGGIVGIIDLEAGVVLRPHGARPWTSHPMSSDTIDAMGAAADHFQELGDQTLRVSQFILGEIGFVTVRGHRTTTLSVQGEGGRMPEPMETVWKVARGD